MNYEVSIKEALNNYARYVQCEPVRNRIENDLINLFGEEVIRSVDFVADRISVEYNDGESTRVLLFP